VKLALPVQPDLSEELELPAAIEGLDMASGLRRVLGKKHVYLSMLRRFVEGQKSVLVDIRNALQRDDPSVAERLAHTLKGASGTIGAACVQQLAAELEDALKLHQSQEELKNHLAAIRGPFAALMSELDQKLPVEIGQLVSSKDSISIGQIKSVCDRLKFLLCEGDSEALDVLQANSNLFSLASPAQYTALVADIRAFKFPEAVITLRSFMESLPSVEVV
jgi:two-component system sensor histidine kinase/response regulator